MAKNHSSSTEGEGVCERLYRAVNCGGSAFKSLRRASPPPPRSSAAPEIPVVNSIRATSNVGEVGIVYMCAKRFFGGHEFYFPARLREMGPASLFLLSILANNIAPPWVHLCQ
nr:uncharacterized protein LOC109191223 [Ipomoea batatas]